MFSITEQLSEATKSQLEAQLKLLNHYAATAFEGAQKVIALNLNTTKASVAQSSAAARELLEAKDPQQFFALSSARVPNFDGVVAYGRELFSIASKTQAELFQTAQEQIKEAGKQAAKPLKLVPAPKAEAKPAVKAEPKVEAKVEQKVEQKVEPKVEAKAEAKVEAKAEPEAKPTNKQLDMLATAPKSKK